MAPRVPSPLTRRRWRYAESLQDPLQIETGEPVRQVDPEAVEQVLQIGAGHVQAEALQEGLERRQRCDAAPARERAQQVTEQPFSSNRRDRHLDRIALRLPVQVDVEPEQV